ncbi:hypothetical protein LTR86_002256 [Recurvomyces mirabilis]|nr:hypothetical protein LTR86_002256 [Recurvomyces mirabilis]
MTTAMPPTSPANGGAENDSKFADHEKTANDDQNLSSDTSEDGEQTTKSNSDKTKPRWRRIYDIIYWTPERLRWNPNSPPKFSMGLNILFGFAGAFTVANLYYNHPILNILAHDFGVPYVKVSNIPTLAQAVGDLAPPNRRAAAMSIVVSGLMLGILLARLLSGIMTQYVSWRYVYWLSVALQYLIFVGLWLLMPDYPATNKGGMNYFKMLWSILVMLTKHPVLVQACLISFFTSATFTNFWTVLTFLLSGKPYYYDPVTIGLFALVGIASMICGPFYARIVIDRFVPWFSVMLGMGWCLLGISIGTYTGTFTVAGPIIQAFVNDFGMQTAQIANRSAIFAVEPRGRNRVNTAFMVATFLGQLVGTSVGAHLYAKGGWIASGSYSMGSIGMALLITLSRGPWEEGWIGWHGGLSIYKKSKTSGDGKTEEQRSDLRRMGTNEVVPTLGRQDGEVDVEKGVPLEGHADQHTHKHGRDNAAEVNATDVEKSLEMRAAENQYDSTTAAAPSTSRTHHHQKGTVAPQDPQA